MTLCASLNFCQKQPIVVGRWLFWVSGGNTPIISVIDASRGSKCLPWMFYLRLCME